jgi:hypothetical protein
MYRWLCVLWPVYGTPSDAILDGLRQYGVSFSVKPNHVGGFTRLQAV